jgi:glutamate synthase domain-containing protein 2
LDTPLLIALQGRFVGECRSATNCRIEMPNVDRRWAVQRLVNLMGSWRDQMLEILGAMGLREVRRLRGELGRAMFQDDLEQEAFGEIEGYSHG